MPRRVLLPLLCAVALLVPAAPAFGAAARPHVSGIGAATAPLSGGVRTTVRGAGFTGVRDVTFGTARGLDVHVYSSRLLHVTAPAHRAGVAYLRVVTSHGTSAGVRFTYHPPPTVTALSTQTAPAGGGGTVTVHGRTFDHLQGITFGSVAATAYRLVSPTELIVTPPPHAPGVAYLRVHTQYGTSPGTSAGRFVYAAPPDPVDDLAADPTETSIGLSWTAPADGSGTVEIRRAAGSTPPATPADGEAVATVPVAGEAFRDTGLSGSSTYSYGVFVQHGGATSAPAVLTAATLSTARPAAPAGFSVGPDGRSLPCTTTPQYFGAARELIASGTLADPDWDGPFPEDLDMQIRVRDYGTTGTDVPSTVVGFDDQDTWSGPREPGSAVSRMAADELLDGHVYGIDARSLSDDEGVSGVSPECFVRTDFDRPAPPVVTTSATSFRVGQPVTFAVSSTDAGSGVDHVNWAPEAADLGGGGGTHVAVSGSGATRTATITLTPTLWGTNYLCVDAVDAAGNQSDVTTYSYYVASG